MKKRFNQYFPFLFVTGELLVITFIFFAALFVSNESLTFDEVQNTIIFGILVLWPAFSYFNKDYKIGRAVSYYNTFKRAFTTVFIFVSLLSIFTLFTNLETLNRHFLATFVLFLLLWVSIYRVSVHLVLDKYRAFGGNVRNAIILGYDELGINLFNTLKKKSHYGIRCVGFFGETEPKGTEHKILGQFDSLLEADLSDVDYIYVSERVPGKVMNLAIAIGETSLKKVKLLPEIKTDALKSFVLRRYDSIPIIDVNNLPLDSMANKVVKRVFDIAFSTIMIVFVLSWLYPILGLLIKLESKGPVLFKQQRHGKGQRSFVCYKFRTMVQNDQSDVLWASKDDPRVTRLGAFLRRTSLDEFPQFFNVFLGSMSIVGPRPHPISLNHAYQDRVEKFARRHASKPGVTGLAQAMGYRGEITEYHQMSSRVRLDRFYLQNWSFWLDLKIVSLTIYSLVRGQELAY